MLQLTIGFRKMQSTDSSAEMLVNKNTAVCSYVKCTGKQYKLGCTCGL